MNTSSTGALIPCAAVAERPVLSEGQPLAPAATRSIELDQQIAANEAAPRSDADDWRVCIHEAAHAVIGREATGEKIGGVTAVPGANYSGLCWGIHFDGSKFSHDDDDDDVPQFCRAIYRLMPGLGESRLPASDVYCHTMSRVVELVAGTEGERRFIEGEPWYAADDIRQARYYSAMITSSTAAGEAFIEFCRVEAAERLSALSDIVLAVAEQLRLRRTLNGAVVDFVIVGVVAARTAADDQARRVEWQSRIANAAAFIEATK
jgi:hypothetical protein